MTSMLNEAIEKDLEWGIPEMLVIGDVTLLVARGGTGKGLWWSDLIARVTRGAPMPGGQVINGSAIVVALEDDEPTALIPRMVAAGADRSRVANLTYVDDSYEAGKHLFQLGGKDGDDMPALRAEIEKRKHTAAPVKMIVIDPLNAVAGCSIAVTRNVRQQIIMPLQFLAREYGIVVVLVHHLNKTGKNVVAGSASIVDAARLVLLITRNGDLRQISIYKSNVANDEGRMLFFTIEGTPPRSRVRYCSQHPSYPTTR